MGFEVFHFLLKFAFAKGYAVGTTKSSGCFSSRTDANFSFSLSQEIRVSDLRQMSVAEERERQSFEFTIFHFSGNYWSPLRSSIGA